MRAAVFADSVLVTFVIQHEVESQGIELIVFEVSA